MRLDRPTPAQLGLTAAEGRVLRALRTPERIQQFIVELPANFEEDGDTLYSVRRVLRHRKAHCIEAAFTAACALWLQGEPPLVMDFFAKGDADHVVALFKRDGCWGAISKSNHIWLRWRDPIYRTPRELAMSYFHEYVLKERKTLRTYSGPVDLRRFPGDQWITSEEECWDVGAALTDVRHYPVATPAQIRRLTRRDADGSARRRNSRAKRESRRDSRSTRSGRLLMTRHLRSPPQRGTCFRPDGVLASRCRHGRKFRRNGRRRRRS